MLDQSEVQKIMSRSRASFSCRMIVFSQIKKTILNNKNLYVTMQKQMIAIIRVTLHALTVKILGSSSKLLKSYGKLFLYFCVSTETKTCHVTSSTSETDQSQLRFQRGQMCVSGALRNFNFSLVLFWRQVFQHLSQNVVHIVSKFSRQH